MASSGQVIERFTEALGRSSPSSVTRMLRSLSEAGLAPMGKAGRESPHGHYEAPHLANLVMALAGTQPSDAAEAVGLLRPLTYDGITFPQYHREPFLPGDFGTVLEQLIEADPEHGMPLTWGVSNNRTVLEIRMCLNPLGADVDYNLPPEPAANIRMDRYRNPEY